MSIVKQLFLVLAKRFGLELQEKPIYYDDYREVNKISLTAVIANRVSTLSMLDSGIDVTGESARARYIDNFVQRFKNEQMAVGAEVSLGTGDCLLKPYTDGKRIGIDIIPNDRFVICESIGSFIKSCMIFADEIKQDNGTIYQRIETQMLKEVNGISVLYIINTAYKNNTEIPLTSVKSWENIPPEIAIPNVEHLLFGRYKCPTVNRVNVNSPNGAKITYGLDIPLKKAMEAYERFNNEYELTEPLIFADKTMFRKNPQTGKIELPKGKERLFALMQGEGMKEYAPNIRTNELMEGINTNFKMLELLAGLSNGILTAPTTNFATATEMKASLQMTFAFMTKFRASLEQGTRDLIDSINILCNVNNITPIGNYEIKFDWSSSYIENIQEQFNRLVTAQGIGAADIAEVRSWLFDEEYERAKERVGEIASEMPNIENF